MARDRFLQGVLKNGTFNRYPNRDEVYNKCVVFVARKVEGEVWLNLSEHSIFGFFQLRKLPGPVSPPYISIIQDLKNQKVLPR